MHLRFDAVIAMPFGGIGVRTEDRMVAEMVYLPASVEPHAPTGRLARSIATQVAAYLEDPNFVFELPLTPRGSDFQQRVWCAIRGIPSGSTRTYGDLARGLRSGPRAVGQACGANWFALVVPCHRVLAAGGIGGFGPRGPEDDRLRIKRWLLRHEGVVGYV